MTTIEELIGRTPAMDGMDGMDAIDSPSAQDPLSAASAAPTELGADIYADQRRVYKYWLEKLDEAEKELDIEGRSGTWATNYARLAGRTTVKIGKQVFQSPNEIGIAVQELIDLCFPTTPTPVLTPDRIQDEETIDDHEWLLTQDLKKTGAKEHIAKAVRDAVCCKHGFLKTVYRTPAGPPTQEPELPEAIIAQQVLYAGQEVAALAQLGQPPQVGPQDVHWIHEAEHRTHLASLPPFGREYWELSVHISDHAAMRGPARNGKVLIRRVNPKDYRYDPYSPEFEDRLWEAERTFEHVDELQADPFLMNTRHVTPGDTRASDVTEADPAEMGPSRAADDLSGMEKSSWVEVWRIHDRKNHLLIILSPDTKSELPLYVGPWPYPTKQDGTPVEIYHRVDLNPINDVRPKDCTTIMEMAWAVQQELDEIYAKRRVLVRKLGRKLLMEKGDFDETAQSDFKDPDKVIVYIEPGSAARIVPYEPFAPPADLLTHAAELKGRLREIIGIWEVSQGVQQANSATAASLMNQRENRRVATKQESLGNLIADMGYSILQLHKAFDTTETLVTKRGWPGMGWRFIRPEDIGDDVGVEIDYVSWNATDDDLRKRRWIEFLNVIANDPTINRMNLNMETFRIFGQRNPYRFIQVPPPPLLMPPGMGPMGPTAGPPAVSGVPNMGMPMGPGQMVGNAAGMQMRGAADGFPTQAGTPSRPPP